MKTEHILIIRFSALGDVAMAVPVVASLAKQYPHVRITVLSRPFARPFFEGLAPNVGFMEADVRKEYHGVRGLNALYRRLTAKRFTAVADLHNVLRSEYLRLRFNLGRYRVAHINKHRKGKRMLARSHDKQMKQQPTSFQNYLDVFERLGYPVTIDFQSIFPSGGGDLSTLPEAFRQKAEGESWIGIAPFAAHEGKVYPLDRMEKVIAQLTERHPNSRIFLFGGGDDEFQVFAEWCQRYPACISASQQLDGMRNELVLMSHLNVMLSMDSGNMHMASLTGIPVVSIWGATHPYAGFMGFNQPLDRALGVEMPCRPCSVFGNKPCLRGDYACLTSIEPQQVVAKLESFLPR
ncbi:MAG: glycosyltransferase family 9 protein [Prevotella sp.]|nr:glycosyltransferase family 9 protein [Prevotella sp.]